VLRGHPAPRKRRRVTMSIDIPYEKKKILHKVSGSAFDTTAPLVR
jgi:hypothetical protein